MNVWLVAALALTPVFVIAAAAAARGAIPGRLVAIQFATAMAVFLLVVLAFAFHQPSSLDLALTLALLGLPGTLLLTVFQERWL